MGTVRLVAGSYPGDKLSLFVTSMVKQPGLIIYPTQGCTWLSSPGRGMWAASWATLCGKLWILMWSLIRRQCCISQRFRSARLFIHNAQWLTLSLIQQHFSNVVLNVFGFSFEVCSSASSQIHQTVKCRNLLSIVVNLKLKNDKLHLFMRRLEFLRFDH